MGNVSQTESVRCKCLKNLSVYLHPGMQANMAMVKKHLSEDKITFYISPVLCCPYILKFWGKTTRNV